MPTRQQLWDANQYALLDFGGGRKLEKFGGFILDRPSPAADGLERSPDVDWSVAMVRLDERGKQISGESPPESWQAYYGGMRFNLALTPFGHVGLFPEQVASWHWLKQQLSLSRWSPQQPVSALNLFAYTGGTTMALAASGAHVVHVDASAPAVRWARRNAADSQLADRPIRWIVEDARKFVKRELRRGKRYAVIVLDPPSFGHGPAGQRWSIDSDLEALIMDCLRLLESGPCILLVTAHSTLPNESSLARMIQRQAPGLEAECARLQLLSEHPAKQLDAGFYVRATH